MPDLSWSPEAREELFAIYVSIGLRNAAAAIRFVDRIERRSAILATLPRLGRRRPHLGPRVRSLLEKPYIILYRTVPDSDDGPVERVEIVSVVDGRRDLGAVF